ncbi:hypothetical protein TPB0596_45780 [Tsukamurella pulmonis]|uniref:Uncharacterized membrane protein YhaH, DUF805 family n=1 Tax=Tsukamurella pulmonis TaxID=47312 RepID=A0A1H1AMW1_9ACTN|nr:DUF805 domain-containing protein [Tsukamurella pulmonis]KXO96053.1 hypothetical protein AXK56_00435 [Tsukamurella pulmonis]KXP08259.1 hypothetical protein AXK57_17525 [Tsukamurella pulmonis]RDH12168.1 DUF805 domain-containing protein [Tsukamurella pulmonis]SDQ40974.1 Uncharacterized membrane protein YhaH, DUF805 family [Tsukamurella pulmonis]SUP26384.1 Inner membrane protein yhaI [Tsukamurella pulmonis]
MTDQHVAAQPVPYEAYPPLYGATFSQAVSRYAAGFVRGRGRASRSEYWWAQLGLLLPVAVAFGLIGIGTAVGGTAGDALAVIAVVLCVITMVAAIGTIALSVRRLHDADLSGWWYLLAIVVGFVPVIGFLVPLLVIGLLPSNPAGIRRGNPAPPPQAFE